MNNSDIAKILLLHAKLLELHNSNPFKIKSYMNAANTVESYPENILNIDHTSLTQIKGIGETTAKNILEIIKSNSFSELDNLLKSTPPGIIELFEIRGLGAKKIKQLWNELNIESIGELYYACKENRLTKLKGFGAKSQLQILQNIEFANSNRNKLLYYQAKSISDIILEILRKKFPDCLHSVTGAIYRCCEIIDSIDIVTTANVDLISKTEELSAFKANYIQSDNNRFIYDLHHHSCSNTFLNALQTIKPDFYEKEEDIYKSINLPYLAPEFRYSEKIIAFQIAGNSSPQFIQYNDIQGCIHNHSVYSDGANTIEEMASYCIQKGFSYLGISDHSKTAVYAGGMNEEALIKQKEEISLLNKKYNNSFKIFFGIESDILNDGSLDYSNSVLTEFDFVIASVHSALKMDLDKADARIIKAIENPYTRILGHPTGRLLLSREGYPINHSKIIDACAANNVIIELNANPHRLDIDKKWLEYSMEKNVLISINPDAHFLAGIDDMEYGVTYARKGFLKKEFCLNAKSTAEVTEIFNS